MLPEQEVQVVVARYACVKHVCCSGMLHEAESLEHVVSILALMGLQDGSDLQLKREHRALMIFAWLSMYEQN